MMRERPKQHRGFTLIELLVVMAIIAVLIALLLPAVQQARESARRSACKNNMKQLGLAMHNYHETYNTFPAPAIVDLTSLTGGGLVDISSGCSWMVNVLPFVEQRGLYDLYNFSYGHDNTANPKVALAGGGKTNNQIASEILSVQHCPSTPLAYEDLVDRQGKAPAGLPLGSGLTLAATHTWSGAEGDYSNISGVRGTFSTNFVYNDPVLWPSGGTGLRHGGLADWIVSIREPYASLTSNNDRHRIGDIYDGTQNTIMFAEMPVRNYVYRLGIRVNASNPQHVTRWPDITAPALVATLGALGISPANLPGYALALGGGMWAEISFSQQWFQGSLYDGSGASPIGGVGGPCIMCTNESSGGIRSFHPGGSHVVMCDGTVHFLSENIAQRTFGYMITREKGEPLSSFTAP